MGWLSQERYEEEFRAETGRFAAAAGRHDPAVAHRYATEVIWG